VAGWPRILLKRKLPLGSFDEKKTTLRAVIESNGVSGLEEDAVFLLFRLKMGEVKTGRTRVGLKPASEADAPSSR
jgi:hypothetical protein